MGKGRGGRRKEGKRGGRREGEGRGGRRKEGKGGEGGKEGGRREGEGRGGRKRGLSSEIGQAQPV